MPKLLLADDSITIQRVIELTFSGEDIQVVPVGDGEQAIARIPIERPDIVLADIGMPKRSGYDVSAFVKGQPDLAHIPVLLLAGAFEPVDDARAAQVKCDGVLVKPFEPQQVIARVRELLDGATGSPTHAVAGVPRPAERLAPRLGQEPPAPAVAPNVAARPAAPPAASASAPARTAPTPPAPAGAAMPVPPPTAAAAPPPAPAAPAAGGDSLDEYFNRLDAAFATLGEKLAATPEFGDDLSAEIPTIDKVLARPIESAPAPAPLPAPRAGVMPPPVEPPDVSSTLSPAVARPPQRADDTPAPLRRSPVADAFSALLALESGEPGARPVRLVTSGPDPIVSDALVDEVTRRVLERLGPDVLNRAVADVVSEVAERLVRQEIARIRNLHR